VEDCRPATSDDLEHVLALAARLRAELSAMRGGELWLSREARAEPLDAAYRALLERDDALVVIGTIDDTPVGFGAVEVETLRTGERLGVITELFVEEEARSVGVGESMAGALLAFCAEQKCCGVDARALPGHRATKNFFEEQGFTARALVMHRPSAPA
jgi:ribosomal protein S18 acetylase RimI-like enzyme